MIACLQNAAAEQVVQDSSNPAQLEGEASSVSLGLSDVTKTETTDSGSDTTPGEYNSSITAQLLTARGLGFH